MPILVELVLLLGLTLFVSALTVHFRDIQSILGHLLHIWFFATPVLYSYAHLGPRMRALLRLNPMTHIVVAYQEALFQGTFQHTAVILETVPRQAGAVVEPNLHMLAEEIHMPPDEIVHRRAGTTICHGDRLDVQRAIE